MSEDSEKYKVDRSENRDKYVVPVLKLLTNSPTQRALAQKLKVTPGYINKAMRVPGEKLSPNVLKRAIDLVATGDVPVALTLDDFESKERLVGAVPKHHPRFREIAGAAGVPLKAEEASILIKRLHGKFVRLFFCRDPDDLEKDALTLDDYVIKERNSFEAEIVQESYEFENYDPKGIVRVREDTIEIQIDYENPRHPHAVFLAEFPRGNTVDAFLAVNLDIKYRTRAVAARPMLFMRVEDFFENEEFYSPKSQIFKSLKRFFEKSLEVNLSKYEIIPREMDEKLLARVGTALKELQKKAVKKQPSSKKSAD